MEMTGQVVEETCLIARSDYFKRFQGISESVRVKLELTCVQVIPVKAYYRNGESNVDSEASLRDDLNK